MDSKHTYTCWYTNIIHHIRIRSVFLSIPPFFGVVCVSWIFLHHSNWIFYSLAEMKSITQFALGIKQKKKTTKINSLIFGSNSFFVSFVVVVVVTVKMHDSLSRALTFWHSFRKALCTKLITTTQLFFRVRLGRFLCKAVYRWTHLLCKIKWKKRRLPIIE